MIDLTTPRPEAHIPIENLIALGLLAKSTPPGNFAELGVYKGGSAYPLYQVAKAQGRKLFLFDTFMGLPNEGPNQQLPAGKFSDTTCEGVQKWMPEARIFEGLFPATLTDEVVDLSFVHVDCDLRGGCTAALKYLYPRLVPGGIMAFDDWGFSSIHEPVKEAFNGRILFTEKTKIPYLVKGER